MNATCPQLTRISDYAAWHAARNPDAIACTLGSAAMSYAEMARRIDQLAAALLAAGVEKGERVATLSTPHPDYLISFLATASIGAIWLGLNPRYQRSELARILTDAEPAVLLTRTVIGDRRYEEDLLDLRENCPTLRQLVVLGNDPPSSGMTTLGSFLQHGSDIDAASLQAARTGWDERTPCLIVYTSGSSGRPKGALLHHEGIIASSHAQNEIWPLDPCRAVNYFPINHVGCVVDCSTPCLVAGGTIHFLEQFDARACLQLMVAHKVTLWGSVPSVFQLQLDLDGFAAYDLHSVQLIAWGGAAMSAPMVERLRELCPRLATNYGMTETAGAITSVAPTDDSEVLSNTVGFPLPGIEVRLCDPTGVAVLPGVAGELQVRSSRNMLGYWRQAEASAAAFTPDGFFRTGDLAVRRPDGAYRLVGRLTEMYKSGGYNIYPREIEEVLESHPAVALAAVVPAPDPLWQEVGVAYVMTSADVDPVELLSFCRTRLASYKVPKQIHLESHLPLLPIGKVDKRALKERAAADAGSR